MKKTGKKSLIWDEEDATVRGNFINFIITVVILCLIVVGAFDSKVADNLVKMDNLIALFFIGSFSIWRIGKYANNKLEITGADTKTK